MAREGGEELLSKTEEEKIRLIQECLSKPKPSKWFFDKPKKIHRCLDCAYYEICELLK